MRGLQVHSEPNNSACVECKVGEKGEELEEASLIENESVALLVKKSRRRFVDQCEVIEIVRQ